MRQCSFLSVNGGQTQQRAFKYTTYATEGFQQNAIVFACIRLIYSAAARLRYKFQQDGKDLETLPANLKPIDDLLKRPDPNMSYYEWLSQLIVFWECGGMAYINGVNLGSRQLSTGEMSSKTQSQLQLLRPDLVDIQLNDGEITGYKFNGQNPIDKDCVMYVRYPDSMDLFQGMPPMRAAAQNIDKSNDATTWGASLFRNSATPSGMVTFELPNIEQDQIDALIAKFENDYAGPENAGKTAFIEANKMTYARMGLSPKEMSISEMDLNTLRMIANVFGVPSPMLSDPETSKYSNYAEAQKDFYQNKVIPMVQHLYGELGHFLFPIYGVENTEIVVDWSHIDFLNDDLNDQTERLSRSTWMTDNEKREAQGLPPLKDPAADLLKPAPSAFFSSNGKLETHQILDHVSPHSKFRTQESRDALVTKQEKFRHDKEPEIVEVLEKFWRKQERLFSEWAIGFFDENPVSDRSDDNGASATGLQFKGTVLGTETRVDSGDIKTFFQNNSQNAELFDALEDLEFSFIKDFGQDAMTLAGSTELFNINRPDLRLFVTEGLTNRSSIINNTTANQLNTLLQKGLTEGVGTSEIKLRIQERFTEMSKGRALAIARTETGIAQSKAAVEGYVQAGTPRHEWVSARDGNVRDSHVAVDGEVRFIGEVFSNGMIAPLIGTDPAEVINCRCVSAPLNIGDEPI